LECGSLYAPVLPEAVKEGKVTEAQINVSLRRSLKGRFLLGQFDNPDSIPWSSLPYDIVEGKEHVQYALEMARKSMVLLKNNKILPLKKTLKKIAVIGPNANEGQMLLGL
jgi:beta-glucosidase